MNLNKRTLPHWCDKHENNVKCNAMACAVIINATISPTKDFYILLICNNKIIWHIMLPEFYQHNEETAKGAPKVADKNQQARGAAALAVKGHLFGLKQVLANCSSSQEGKAGLGSDCVQPEGGEWVCCSTLGILSSGGKSTLKSSWTYPLRRKLSLENKGRSHRYP